MRVLPRLFLSVVSSITVPTVKEHPPCVHLVLTLASLQLLQVQAALPAQLDIFATVLAQPQVYTATLVERLRLHLAPLDPTVPPEASIQRQLRYVPLATTALKPRPLKFHAHQAMRALALAPLFLQFNNAPLATIVWEDLQVLLKLSAIQAITVL